jgi:hypothetical protein
LLGLPPNEIIEEGRNSYKYFIPIYEDNGMVSYRLKTPQEYEYGVGMPLPP